jgi:hypothetical protein
MTNVEGVVFSTIDIINCQTDEKIFLTNSQDICLRIKAQGVTFYRIANEDGVYSEWKSFIPNNSLDTSIVPWILSSGNGTKNLSIQLQTNNMIGFPETKTIILQTVTPAFNIQFFLDEALTLIMPVKNGIPVLSKGDAFIRILTGVPLKEIPTFDIISQGKIVSSQTMELLDSEETLDPLIGASEFKGSFVVLKEDGLFNIDGPARIVPHGNRF